MKKTAYIVGMSMIGLVPVISVTDDKEMAKFFITNTDKIFLVRGMLENIKKDGELVPVLMISSILTD